MSTRVSETIYFVNDLDQAVAHYTEKFGFKLLEKQDWGWALLMADEKTRLGLLTESVWPQAGSTQAGLPTPRLAFKTDEIEAEHSRLSKNGVTVTKIKGDTSGVRSFNFVDQDENEFFMWDDGTKIEG